VIFVALGTHEQPFDRALTTVASLAGQHELVIQHGHTPPRLDIPATWIGFAPYDRILGLMRDADTIVCHAGVGTILSALGAGKCPVVLPRLARHGEHVDDHQLQITQTFASHGFVVACLEPDNILASVEQARNAFVDGVGPRGDLRSAVADATAPPHATPSWRPVWSRWKTDPPSLRN
jgi:UDP-N-acetylglucosamine transferase subunit ALG13